MSDEQTNLLTRQQIAARAAQAVHFPIRDNDWARGTRTAQRLRHDTPVLI